MRETFRILAVMEDDFFDMCRILKSASSDWDERILRSTFSEGYCQWGIFLQENLLGFLIVRNMNDYWELLQIVVSKEKQSQGLGKRLLKFLITELRKNKAKKIELEVRASNFIAISLYRALGFQEVGVRKKYYGGVEDALLMDLTLMR